MNKEFESIKNDLEKLEEEREKSIKVSRSIINLSKKIIHNLHKNNLKEAEVLIKDIEKELKNLPEACADTNIDATAIQEYVEALAYYHILKFNKLPTRKDLNVNTVSYLSGLCDLTGELIRRMTNALISGDQKEAKRVKDFISEIYDSFINLDIHRGDLRKKSDMLRWNLNKAEDLLLQMKGR